MSLIRLFPFLRWITFPFFQLWIHFNDETYSILESLGIAGVFCLSSHFRWRCSFPGHHWLSPCQIIWLVLVLILLSCYNMCSFRLLLLPIDPATLSWSSSCLSLCRVSLCLLLLGRLPGSVFVFALAHLGNRIHSIVSISHPYSAVSHIYKIIASDISMSQEHC